MWKKRIALAVLLLLFWIVIGQTLNLEHLLSGVLLVLLLVWFWRDLLGMFPKVPSLKKIMPLLSFILTMIKAIIDSNLAVIKTIIFNTEPVQPYIVIFKPPIKSDWGKVLFANCITITPGTVTIDVHPETGYFVVHALTESAAKGLSEWNVIEQIKVLEL
jgi:multicomponent Na+:H+ antiporter subunit E